MFHCNFNYVSKGLYIKYARRGQMVFVGGGGRGWGVVMKYFRHILIGHKIFFKIFDGPQNISFYSILVILFFKLRGLEHKTSKLAIKEI